MIASIIVLIILLLIAGVIEYVHIKLKRLGQEFSMEDNFGVSSFADLFTKAKEEYEETPKAVAGMTRMFLPLIKQDFPDFSYDEMKGKAQNVITSYFLAVNGADQELLQEGNSELKNKLANRLRELATAGYHEHFEEIKIHRMELDNYAKRDGRCIITFEASLQYKHYMTDTSGKVLKGSKTANEQARYEADLIYIQDRNVAGNDVDGTIGLNCPNCGAPLTNLGVKVCPYCRTPVIELNIHAWSFSDVRER